MSQTCDWQEELKTLEDFNSRIRDAAKREDLDEYIRLLEERKKWLESLD